MVGIAICENNDENKAFTKFLFKIGDKDHSNGIDRKEFKQLLIFFAETTEQAEMKKEDLDSKIENIFFNYDNTNKGFLNEEEFANAFEQFNKNIKLNFFI